MFPRIETAVLLPLSVVAAGARSSLRASDCEGGRQRGWVGAKAQRGSGSSGGEERRE